MQIEPEIVAAWLTVAGLVGEGGRRFVKVVRRGVSRTSDAFKKVDQMSVALGENGGKSIADRIKRIEEQGITTSADLQLVGARINALGDVIERPIFETDLRGRVTHFNRAAELLLGYSSAQLVGMGWVTVIDPAQRDRVLEEWSWGIRDSRVYRIRARLICAGGDPLDVLMVAQPTIDGRTGTPIGWFGAIEVIHSPIKEKAAS